MMRATIGGAMLLLAACGGGEDKAAPAPQDDVATAPVTETAPLPLPADSGADGGEPDLSLPPPSVPDSGIGTGDKAIPTAIQGRWARDASDCPKRPGTDLTAMVIDAAALRFHESHGELARIRQRGANRLVADYKFSGEGMEWDRLMLLDVQDGGRILIRRDYGEDAVTGPIRYTRCDA